MTTHVSSGRAQGRAERNATPRTCVALDRGSFVYDIQKLGKQGLRILSFNDGLM